MSEARENDDLQFLYNSIADTQGTIRAIDIKSGFLFLILFMPLYSAQPIYSLMVSIAAKSIVLRVGIYGVTIFWTVALAVQFYCLMSTSNPYKQIRGSSALGTFYSADLYKLGIFSDGAIAERTLDEELAKMPRSVDQIRNELVFEKMKLTYIRDVKLRRSNRAISFAAAWLSLSLICFIVYIA